MRRVAATILAILWAATAMAQTGANPKYIEELKIGGGYQETTPADGGIDLTKTGDILLEGALTMDVGKLLKLGGFQIIDDDADSGDLEIQDSANNIMLSITDEGSVGSLTVTDDLAVNGGDITSTGTLNISSTGATTITEALTLDDILTASQSLAGGAVHKFINTNTGATSSAELNIAQGTNSATALRFITTSTGFTTSGALKQDGGSVFTGTQLSGGLSLFAQGSSADVRIYAGGIADGDLVATFDNAQLTTLTGDLLVSGGDLTIGGAASFALGSTTHPGHILALNATTLLIESDLRIGLNTTADPVLTFLGSTNDGTITWDENLSNWRMNGQLIMPGDSAQIVLGVADTGLGSILRLEGGASAEDPLIIMHNSDDNNAVENLWTLQPDGVNFLIGPASDIDEFIFGNAGDFTMGGDLTVTGVNINGPIDIGDDTNDTSFAADGLQTMAGTAIVSKDLNFGINVVKLGGVNDPNVVLLDNFNLVIAFDAAAEEEVFSQAEIPNDYDAGTDLHFHFHWAPSDGNAGNVIWAVEYTVTSPNSTESIIAGEATVFISDATDTSQYEHLESADITVTGTGFAAEDIISMRIFRDATGALGTDDYAADAYLLSFDIEYLCDRIGTDERW